MVGALGTKSCVKSVHCKNVSLSSKSLYTNLPSTRMISRSRNVAWDPLCSTVAGYMFYQNYLLFIFHSLLFIFQEVGRVLARS